MHIGMGSPKVACMALHSLLRGCVPASPTALGQQCTGVLNALTGLRFSCISHDRAQVAHTTPSCRSQLVHQLAMWRSLCGCPACSGAAHRSVALRAQGRSAVDHGLLQVASCSFCQFHILTCLAYWGERIRLKAARIS